MGKVQEEKDGLMADQAYAIAIGSTVWYFNYGHRVYRDDKSGPIWREHWLPLTITGENSRSWLVEMFGRIMHRIPKNDWDRSKYAFSQAEIDDQQWIRDYRNSLARSVERVEDAATLRQIAALTGWKEPGI